MEMLIKQADDLMYQAKKEGKNRLGLRSEITKKVQLPAPVFIGREHEISWCLSQLKEYKAIFIVGQAGIGKTRLVSEISSRMSGPIILQGNAYAALSSVPYHPIKKMFNELLNKDAATIQRTFRQISEPYRSEILKFLPKEGLVLLSKEQEMDRFHFFNGIARFINQMAESLLSQTLILFLDDLHWADGPTCRLLDYLMRSLRDNVKILGTYRIEEIRNSQIAQFLGIWARERLSTYIELSALNELQSYQLLEAIIGTIPQSWARFIYQQSGGNPFYIEEIIRELVRQHKLFWNGHEWVIEKDLVLPIPSSINETVIRRLKFLEPHIKTFLEIAAVFGQEFGVDIIARASQTNVGEVLDAIAELISLGFIKERGPEVFFFSEDILRQIVYQKISRPDLLKYHKAVGEAIETFYYNQLPNYYEQLALHFTMANDTYKACYYSKEAALKAKANYAHDQAIRFFKNALRYEDQIDEIFKIKFSLAEISFLAGKHAMATRYIRGIPPETPFDHLSLMYLVIFLSIMKISLFYRRGIYSNSSTIKYLNACLRINPNDYKIYERLGAVFEDIGDYKRSLRYYQQGLKITKKSRAAYSFRSSIPWVYSRLGQYLRAKKGCEEIIKDKKLVNKKDLAQTYVILGTILLRLGEFKKAEIYLKKGLLIRTSLGDKKGIAACYIDLGIRNQQNMNFKISEDFYKKALGIYEEIGYQLGIVVASLDLGALYDQYDLLKSEEYYSKALSIAKLIGAKRDLVYLYDNLGAIHFRRLMDDQALKDYKAGLEYAKETGFDEARVFINLNLSEFYREQGQTKKGRQCLRTAQAIASKVDTKYLNLNCLIEEIEYLLLDKNLKKAALLVRRLSAQVKSEPDLNYRVSGYMYQGKVLSALKRYHQAQQYYRKAYGLIRSLPKNQVTAEIYYLMGVAYKKEGNDKEALKAFLSATEIFKKIGNLRYLAKIEEEIASVDLTAK